MNEKEIKNKLQIINDYIDRNGKRVARIALISPQLGIIDENIFEKVISFSDRELEIACISQEISLVENLTKNIEKLKLIDIKSFEDLINRSLNQHFDLVLIGENVKKKIKYNFYKLYQYDDYGNILENLISPYHNYKFIAHDFEDYFYTKFKKKIQVCFDNRKYKERYNSDAKNILDPNYLVFLNVQDIKEKGINETNVSSYEVIQAEEIKNARKRGFGNPKKRKV